MPPTSGPDGTLARVARRVARNHDLIPGERSSARVMPVAHHPAANATKFSRAYSHRTIVGGIEHNPPQEAPEAFADAVLQAEARGR
jgi:pimeloyl-ACP methyl ester carboxylesterase